ncbi:BatD family protein [Rhabdochromatium marinum]|uniref:BatD family protein n=1 Tax=Rhabdochromatium marinum TaxID=48729 RepID=UPI0019080688|nr:BatD family protein [Rhabdochromatium marinum]
MHHRTGCVLLLILTLMCPLLANAAVTATLDRQQLYESEVLTLSIEASGLGQTAEPDLTPLEQDFDILGTSRGSQISIINGRSSSSQQWRISLKPRRLGELRIPALSVGAERTQPLSVQVSETPEGALGHPGDDVFVELTLERPEGVSADDPVMVQQQLPLVVRLYSAQPLRGGSLSDPRAEGAVLERLGADRRYSSRRDGRDYQVIERRYSLSPEHSGTLRIPPVIFEGELMTGAGRGSGAGAGAGTQRSRLDRMFQDFPFATDFTSGPLSLFESGQPVRAQSRALTLQVKARPEDFSGQHWLPAEALSVEDSWAQQPPALRVGEPVTRTLTLVAKGLAGSQIPDVNMRIPAAVRSYREPTKKETRTDGQAVYAVSKQSMTLIPTQAGSLQLPELHVRWWDIKAERERETRVPALNLTVAAGAPPPATKAPTSPAAAAAAPSDATASADQPAPQSTTNVAAAPDTNSSQSTSGQSTSASNANIRLILGALIGLLVLAAAGVGAIMIARKKGLIQPRLSQTAASAAPPPRQSALREAVRQAADQHDAPGTAEALLALARTRWPDDPPLNLAMLARRLGRTAPLDATVEAAQSALAELERALYAPSGAGWSGQGFWDQVRGALTQAGEQSTEEDAASVLAPLYPQRN